MRFVLEDFHTHKRHNKVNIYVLLSCRVNISAGIFILQIAELSWQKRNQIHNIRETYKSFVGIRVKFYYVKIITDGR